MLQNSKLPFFHTIIFKYINICVCVCVCVRARVCECVCEHVHVFATKKLECVKRVIYIYNSFHIKMKTMNFISCIYSYIY